MPRRDTGRGVAGRGSPRVLPGHAFEAADLSGVADKADLDAGARRTRAGHAAGDSVNKKQRQRNGRRPKPGPKKVVVCVVVWVGMVVWVGGSGLGRQTGGGRSLRGRQGPEPGTGVPGGDQGPNRKMVDQGISGCSSAPDKQLSDPIGPAAPARRWDRSIPGGSDGLARAPHEGPAAHQGVRSAKGRKTTASIKRVAKQQRRAKEAPKGSVGNQARAQQKMVVLRGGGRWVGGG